MSGLTHFWSQGDAITRGVALLLLLMSVSAWVVILWKGWLLRRVRSDIARAVPAFWAAPTLDAGAKQLQAFDREAARQSFVLLASKDGRDGSIRLHQDVDLSVTLLAAGGSRALALGPGRGAWVHVARGAVSLNGQALAAGDGAAVSAEQALVFVGERDAEILVFDLG